MYYTVNDDACIALGTAVKDKAHLHLHSRVASVVTVHPSCSCLPSRAEACACFLAQFFAAHFLDAPYSILILFLVMLNSWLLYSCSLLLCLTHSSALQVITITAHLHGASFEQALPLNTAYVCWHLAKYKQLGSILDMVASATGRPHLTASFAATVARLGQQSNAGTLPDLLEVCCS